MKDADLVRGTALLTATGIVSQICGFFYRIALSRLIGAETMGLFQLVMPVFSILLSATAVGLTAAVSTLAARRLALGDKSGVRRLVDGCVGWFLLLGGGLGVLVALGSDPISVYLLGDARTQLGLILMVPCFLLTGVENLHKHFFYGTGRVRAPALIELCEQFIRAGAVLGLLVAFLPQNPERTVGLIFCGMILCEIFSAVTLSLLFRRALRGVAAGREAGLARTVAAVAVPVGGSALLNNLLGSVDTILLPQRLVAGGTPVSEAMAQFGVLFGMTTPLLCLPTAFIGALGLVLLPGLSQRMALGQKAAARDMVEGCLGTVWTVLLPMLAWLTAVGPELGAFLFKEETVGRFMLPMAVGVALNARQSVLGCALNGIGRQRAAARIALIGGGVQLLFTLFTVARWGLEGYVAGYLVSSLLCLWLERRAVKAELGLHREPFFRGLAPLLAALLTGLCAHLLFHDLLDRGLTVLPAALGAALFSALLYLATLQAQGALPKGKKETRCP